MQIVTKELKFEAAHRLVNGYPGKCRNNHGHSWVVFISVRLLEGRRLNKYGFVKDYGDFAPLRNWIDNNLDHATIVSDDDDSFIAFLESDKQRLITTQGNPTSENLSKIIYDKAHELLDDDCCEVCEVRIKETCTSEAIYRP
jgi:6-pyruvoyltetrahydropterin/6-carboxytetrahydropterin synthase